MSEGIIIFAIVLCLSLLARLFISQLFQHRVFSENSSMPLRRGIIPPPPSASNRNKLKFKPTGFTVRESENRQINIKYFKPHPGSLNSINKHRYKNKIKELRIPQEPAWDEETKTQIFKLKV